MIAENLWNSLSRQGRTREMAEHPDVQRFRRALDARGSSTVDAETAELLDELFADDVVWHGAASGKDEVIAKWNALARNGGPAIEVDEVYADGIHTVSVQR